MTRDKLIGHHRLPNGWTVSVIGHGYGSQYGYLEALAWNERGDEVGPSGWLTEAEAEAFIAEIRQK